MEELILPEDVFTNQGNTLTRGDVRISWVELGEGINGEYDEDDPDDIELLRFDLKARGSILDEYEKSYSGGEDADDYYTLSDGSYCTNFPAYANESMRRKGLEYLMLRLYDCVLEGNWKKKCEELSWIGDNWVNGTPGDVPTYKS